MTAKSEGEMRAGEIHPLTRRFLQLHDEALAHMDESTAADLDSRSVYNIMCGRVPDEGLVLVARGRLADELVTVLRRHGYAPNRWTPAQLKRYRADIKEHG